MKSILLIEDNKDIRENTTEILELANYKVRSAANGKLGIQAALNEKPDLIICDIMMPELDGFGVLHLINKNPQLSGIPFIFLTSKAERSDMRKGMEMGADDYITKPFTDIELLTAVESRLKKINIFQSNYAADETGLKNLIHDVKGISTLDNLTEDSHTNSFNKGETIYHEGNYPNKLFYIKKGSVRTFKVNEIGKELTIDLLNEGDFLGYTALIENSKYNESAQAFDNCELSIIPREDFELLMNNNIEVSKKFITMLAKNVSDKENQLLSLAYNSLRKRVADALLMLEKKYNNSDGEKFTINISRENLAKIAGTATESLIRTLSDFKAEKLIEIKNGNITIENESKLAAMIN